MFLKTLELKQFVDLVDSCFDFLLTWPDGAIKVVVFQTINAVVRRAVIVHVCTIEEQLKKSDFL